MYYPGETYLDSIGIWNNQRVGEVVGGIDFVFGGWVPSGSLGGRLC